MWRGRTTASSRYMRGSPNADSASRIASVMDASRVSADSTRRMPRPPPPETALTNTGKPISSARLSSVATSSEGSVLRSVGRPASRAAAMARALLPASLRTSWSGPTNVIPACSHAVARSGFSERKP